MRTVSMVPSWTETLIECGINVVGRTRFCVHPAKAVAKIPAVGGTKDIKWEKVNDLNPDILILDQEENPKAMADECPVKYFASHIRNLTDIERDLRLMSEIFENKQLELLANRWRAVAEAPPKKFSWPEAPGILEWIKPPTDEHKFLVYLIWHNPWMAVSKGTFIGSVVEKIFGPNANVAVDFPSSLTTQTNGRPIAYPEIQLEHYDPQKTVLLFSTEPFPFAKKKDLIKSLPFSSAIIDGESYSWFGIRALEFLEKNL